MASTSTSLTKGWSEHCAYLRLRVAAAICFRDTGTFCREISQTHIKDADASGMSRGERMVPRGYYSQMEFDKPDQTPLNNCCARTAFCEAGKCWKLCCCIGSDFECGYGPITFLLNGCTFSGLCCPWCWCDCVWWSDDSRNRTAWRGFGDEDFILANCCDQCCSGCCSGSERGRVHLEGDTRHIDAERLSRDSRDPRHSKMDAMASDVHVMGTRQKAASLVLPHIVMRMEA